MIVKVRQDNQSQNVRVFFRKPEKSWIDEEAND